MKSSRGLSGLVSTLAVGVLLGGGALAQASAAATASTQQTTVTRYVPQVTHVRTGPGTTFGIAANLASGSSVTGTMLANGWILIQTPAAQRGRYVSGAVLTATAPATPPPATSTPAPATSASTVTGWIASSDHSVNLRSGPGFAYPVVGHVAKKSQVSGTVSGDWVKTSGGYLNRGLIETTSSNIFAINGYVPASTMCPVPVAWNSPQSFDPGYTPSTTRFFNCAGLAGLTQLETAFQARFHHPAWIDLTYRDHAEEVYWAKTKPNAASPVGTSNHWWGLAVDFREQPGVDNEFDWGGPGYRWLASNAGAYGFAGDPVPYGTSEESYHWNFVG